MPFSLPTQLLENMIWGPRDEDNYEVDAMLFMKNENRIGAVCDFVADAEAAGFEEKKDRQAERSAFQVVEKSGALKDTKRTKDAAAGSMPRRPFNPNAAKKPGRNNGKHNNGKRNYPDKAGEVLRFPTIQMPEQSAFHVDLLPFSKGEKGFATVEDGGEPLYRGRCFVYDNANDQITFNKPARFEVPKNDPVPQPGDLISDVTIRQMPPAPTGRTIYTTDKILAALAAAPKSKFSWDATVIARDNVILMHEREFEPDNFFKHPCRVGCEWVRETAPSAMTPLENTEGVNNAYSLAEESARLQAFLRNHVHSVNKKGTKAFEPIADASKSQYEGLQTLLRYRTVKIKPQDGGEEITVIVRCEVDGVQKLENENAFYRIFALLEGPSSETVKPWKERPDKQPGKLVTDELGLNSGKFARWAALSQLAGAKMTKIAFCTRSNAKEPGRYEVMHIESAPTDSFARQVALPLRNMWTVLAHIAQTIFSKKLDKCYIMKEPNKPKLYVFQRPTGDEADASSSSSDSSSDSDSSSSDSSSDDSESDE